MSTIERAISAATGSLFRSISSSTLSGGCINQASRLQGEDGREYFVKKNHASFLPFFEAEGKALEEIRSTQSIHAPEVIASGREDKDAFLVLEYIQEGTSQAEGQAQLGQLLAKMHNVEQPYFGWNMDNCIGATPQPNPRSDNWAEFYRDQRLAHQFDLAAEKGKKFEGAEDLLSRMASFFSSYHPRPALLHGDLWGGNASYDQNGTPFIFDPASYYGDREADLAFTYMFGGFSPAFYQAYQQESPLDEGFKIRKTLYNLYHELNHFNLFGGGYASSAQSSIIQLLRH
jgi:protein-ribulosamine 3-kinase